MSKNTSTGQNDHIWYFAYGSNMASTIFLGDRGIRPLDSARVRIPGWTLVFVIPGMPYKEPLFASIRELNPNDQDCACKKPNVVGVAYLLTRKQYVKVVSSEGGGVVYANISLIAVPVGEEDAKKTGDRLTVRTMQTGFSWSHVGKPSRRYIDLILDGSTEFRLPLSYHQYLAAIPTYIPPKSPFRRLGAALFLICWMPILAFVHGLVDATVDNDGNAPPLIKTFVRAIFVAMWVWHDYVHSPIWGRGDGADQDEAIHRSS